jgi:hypothetical protein
MTTANNPTNNLSPWQPGQSGNPSGRPKGTRDLTGYVLETTDGGKGLVDALVCLARGVLPNVAMQEGSRPRKDQQVRPADQLKAIEMLLDRGFGRSPQQLDIAHNVSSRPRERKTLISRSLFDIRRTRIERYSRDWCWVCWVMEQHLSS